MYILLKKQKTERFHFHIFDYLGNALLFSRKYLSHLKSNYIWKICEWFLMRGNIFFPDRFRTTNNHLGAALFGEFRFSLFGHSRARRTGDWAGANYISLAQAYMKMTEKEGEKAGKEASIYACIHVDRPIVTIEKRKGQTRTKSIAIVFTCACSANPNLRLGHRRK